MITEFVQLRGNFIANTDLFQEVNNKISREEENYHISLDYISHLGIQSKKGNLFEINGEIFEIGHTGMLEIEDVISSFSTLSAINKNTLIDMFIKEKKEVANS